MNGYRRFRLPSCSSPCIAASIAVAVFALIPTPIWLNSSSADLRTAPIWFDPSGVANGADWHYRVPVTLPASADVGSTIKLDVDFSQLLTQLGVDSTAVDFDENSVRLVRPTGVLATEQEFSDEIFAGLLDANNNNRGEVKFIAQDTAAVGAYYLYFDITENGVKPVNPQSVINGNFERSTGTVGTGWTVSSQNTGGGERNLVQTTTFGATASVAAACSTNAANNFDNSPNNNGAVATGEDWYLLGYRENCEDGGGGVELVQLSRIIENPTGAARGDLTFNFQVQSFDGLQVTGDNYDYFRVVVNGVVVDHTALGINNAAAPALRIRNIGIGRAGFTPTLVSHGWKLATLDMTQFPPGPTTIRFDMRLSAADDNYRSWVRLDDVEWAVQTGTLGTAEAFGVNITLPNDTSAGAASIYSLDQTMTITAQVDAQAMSVTAIIVDQAGAVVNAGAVLFDDGTHGDAVAGDGIWTNDGSDPVFATHTFSTTDPQGTNWQITVRALDSSVSSLGVPDGLLHVDSQPVPGLTQGNYWNIDQQGFAYTAPTLTLIKLSFVIRDPFNATTNPKRVPGALVEYRLSVANTGDGAVDSNRTVVTDPLPSDVALCVSVACSGGADPLVFDDTASPVATNLSYSYGTDVSFSTDGVNFNYTPIADAEGFDAAISHVRVAPTGAFAGGGASFNLRLFVRVE